MRSLEEQKISEEIKGLKARRYLDIVKGVALLIGSIVVFIAIQMPGSILNKKVSQESINRERAKLMLDLIHNNKDFETILLELSVIEKAYPDNDTFWINEIKSIYRTKLDKSNNSRILNTLNTTKSERVVALRAQLDSMLDRKERLQTEVLLEVTGKGQTGYARIGPTVRAMQQQIDGLDEQISAQHRKIDDSLE